MTSFVVFLFFKCASNYSRSQSLSLSFPLYCPQLSLFSLSLSLIHNWGKCHFQPLFFLLFFCTENCEYNMRLVPDMYVRASVTLSSRTREREREKSLSIRDRYGWPGPHASRSEGYEILAPGVVSGQYLPSIVRLDSYSIKLYTLAVYHLEQGLSVGSGLLVVTGCQSAGKATTRMLRALGSSTTEWSCVSCRCLTRIQT